MPTLRRDHGQEQVFRSADRLDADFLAWEVGDAADPFAYEQLEAADMHARQCLHRDAAIDAGDLQRGEV